MLVSSFALVLNPFSITNYDADDLICPLAALPPPMVGRGVPTAPPPSPRKLQLPAFGPRVEFAILKALR